MELKHIDAGRTWEFRWAIPDGHRGGGMLRLEIDGESLREISIPTSSDQTIHVEEIDTSDRATSIADLRLIYNARSPSVVAVDALWH